VGKEDGAYDSSFDLEQLRKLFQMMEEFAVTEVTLRRGDQKWRVQRGPREVAAAAASAYQPQPAPVSSASGEAPASAPAAADNTVTINCPTVGTFYAAPNPDEEPLASIGSQVRADTIVCIVEAMKVFNQIPAGVSGTIIEALVNNGDAVEFGQPLFRVTPG